MNGRISTLLGKETTRINGLLKKPLPHKTLKRRLKKLWNKKSWIEKAKAVPEIIALNQDVGTLSAQ